MDLCRRFFDDWGLRTIQCDYDEAVLETRQGPRVILKNLHTQKFLFPSPEQGSCLREVVWGLGSQRDVDVVGERLSRNRTTKSSADGSVHSTDPFGYGIGFKVWEHGDVESTHNRDMRPTRMNVVGSRQRINEPAVHYARAEPTRIGHVVFEIAGPEALHAGEEFYLEGLGFSASDQYPERGLFCRCAPESDHHNLALLTTRNRRTRFEHAAFEVRDVHEVFGGGLHFAEHGWDTVIGPGRHKVSSAYFWYFHNPCGGQVEYFSDTDFLNKEWKPRSLPPTPDSIAEWASFDGMKRFKGFRKAE
jgi:catechol-2,3-dioxygenase